MAVVKRLIIGALVLLVLPPLLFVASSAMFVLLVGFFQSKAAHWKLSPLVFWQTLSAQGYSPLIAIWTYRNDAAFAKWGMTSVFLAVVVVLGVTMLIVYPFVASGSRLTKSIWRRDYTRPFIRGVTDNHGHASWMSNSEALEIFSAKSRQDGINKVIGRLPDGTTLYDTLDSGNTGLTIEFSGSGTGKTSSLCTQIARFAGPRVVLDPSCEIAPMMWKYLTKDLKQRVYIVSPDQKPVDADGKPQPWAHLVGRYNPLDWVDISKPLAGTHVGTFANSFFEDKPHGDNAYFDKACRSLIAIILSDILWTTGEKAPPKTLGTLRAVLSLGADELENYLRRVTRESPSSMARAAVGPLYNMVKQAGKTFAGVWDEANQATMWLTEPSLAFMVSGSDFLTTDICEKQAITVMFHLPLDLLQTYPALGRVLFGSFVSAKIASKTTNWVLLAPDEPWALGKAKWMEIVIAAGRKHGLAMHAPWLDVGTLERIWGGKSWRDFWFSNARCIMFSRLNDAAVARDISQACGQHGVLAYAEGSNRSVQAGTGWGRASRGSTQNLHEIKRDVLMPYEVIQDPTRDDLLVLGLGKPLRLKRATWWKYPDLRRGIAPTQYQEGRVA